MAGASWSRTLALNLSCARDPKWSPAQPLRPALLRGRVHFANHGAVCIVKQQNREPLDLVELFRAQILVAEIAPGAALGSRSDWPARGGVAAIQAGVVELPTQIRVAVLKEPDGAVVQP